MTEYAEGQVVKGRQPPSECPDGFYWRKSMGQDAFKLYPRKERKAPGMRPDAEGADPRMTVNRVAEGVRYYMQNEDGFKRVLDAASLSVKALQNLSAWANAAATERAEKEKVRSAALAKANAALKDVGLVIGPDGTVQPIPVV